MTEQRDAARVKFFPPAVPLLTVLLGVLLNRIWPIDIGFVPSSLVRYGLGITIVVGSMLTVGAPAVIMMRRSGQSENPWKPTTSIVARGPFRITRNPMYLQMVVGCVGFAILFWNVWILLLTPLAALALQQLVILPEEAYLERKFGDDYRAYKRRVRRWI
jgi:protein-S-isoprenylcysteine O-methyltransferase Ste14